MKTKRIILVGLGPHARRIYYPFLEKHAQSLNLELAIVIDLQSQAQRIQEFLATRSLQPKQLTLIQPDQSSIDDNANGHVPPILETAFAKECDAIIIASEARTHETYIRWALANDVDILTDKPIVTPPHVANSVHAANSIYNRFLNLEQQLANSSANMVVQCQRRSHAGYQLIQDYLTEFLQTYEIPISYLNVYHADGMWPMPDEFFSRENHPYKYGYGKLMHSGYHFVDLFAWLAGLNQQICHKAPNNAEMFVQSFRPADLLHQFSADDYDRFFSSDTAAQNLRATSSLGTTRDARTARALQAVGNSETIGELETITDLETATLEQPSNIEAPSDNREMRQRARVLGELDAFVQCQLKHNDAVVTTGSINLQQNSFSRRAWPTEAKDVYKGNGRVRHEQVNLQVGSLLNIQVHSYQSYESTKQPRELATAPNLPSNLPLNSQVNHANGPHQCSTSIEPGGPGHDAHFDIHIYRNSELVGGNAYEKYSVGTAMLEQNRRDQNYLGHNEKAREKIFLDFMRGSASDSHFSTHKLTNLMLAQIYRCMAQAQQAQVPYTAFAL